PTRNPIQARHAGEQDTFAVKVNAAGNALVYSTYLGGSANDVGHAITVDSAGNAYITGLSNSPNFPTARPLQASYKGGEGNDTIVFKVNSAGTALVYSTYLGGSKNDESRAIAVDSAGNATITGYTQSSDFPTAKPLQANFAGGSNDAFITQLSADGSALVFSTFFGGAGGDFGRGLALDAARNVYLTGYTESSNFPTRDPLQPAYAGGTADAFAAKLNAAGSAAIYSTYLGGGAYERGRGIAVDSAGSVYVSGRTESRNFITSKAGTTPFGGGPNDAFVLKISDR
ncbi:MAG TPA: SBBP repeat-containing protein, partial [Terriglobia bacterium]